MKVKKKTLKKSIKVRRKRQSTTIVSTDDIYRLINRVQINKKKVTFCLSMEESQVGKNVLDDLNVKYRIVELRKCIRFFLSPSKDVAEEEIDIPIDMEEPVYLPEEE